VLGWSQAAIGFVVLCFVVVYPWDAQHSLEE
jgi:hypothetical protein